MLSYIVDSQKFKLKLISAKFLLTIISRNELSITLSTQIQVQVLRPVLPLQRHWDFSFYFFFSLIILYFSSSPHSWSYHQMYSYINIYLFSSFFSTHSAPHRLFTCSADIHLLYLFLLFSALSPAGPPRSNVSSPPRPPRCSRRAPLSILSPDLQLQLQPPSLQLSSRYFLNFSIFIVLWLLNSNSSTSWSSSLTPCLALICPIHYTVSENGLMYPPPALHTGDTPPLLPDNPPLLLGFTPLYGETDSEIRWRKRTGVT